MWRRPRDPARKEVSTLPVIEALAEQLVDADEELALDLLAALHVFSTLETDEPSVLRLRDFRHALRAAVAARRAA
jgi:hypothetical protein